jgi:hypothetical protein
MIDKEGTIQQNQVTMGVSQYAYYRAPRSHAFYEDVPLSSSCEDESVENA